MPSEKREARRPIGGVEAGIGTVLLTGVVCAFGSILAQRAMLAEAAQAVAAQWGASWLGGDGEDDETPPRAVAGRIGLGAAAGVACALLTMAFARVTGGVTSVVVTASLGPFLLQALDAVLVATRDELLLHGLVLRVARGRPRAVGLLACAASSAAWAVGASGAAGLPLLRVVSEAALGTSFAAAWQRERGPWAAVTAHAAWLVATGPGLVFQRAAPGIWGGGDAGPLGGLSAGVALTIVAVAAVAASRRGETSTTPAALG